MENKYHEKILRKGNSTMNYKHCASNLNEVLSEKILKDT